MKTDQLIQAMAADTCRTRPVTTTLPVALALGTAVAVAIFVALLGVRPDLAEALTRPMVLLKQLYPPLLALGAFGAAVRMARPGDAPGPWLWLLATVPVLLGIAAFIDFTSLSAPERMRVFIGASRPVCLGMITLMGLPILAGSLWALRRGASTRPALSGALAGLMSGGAAATVYAFHCTEDSPLFYGVWYVLAIAAVAALGALLGRRYLRW